MCISVAYNTKHSKEDITIALDKGQNIRITNNGWVKLLSSLSDPINLGDLKTPGNYSILFWTDGPNFGDKSITPINATVVKVDGVITQLVNAGGKYFNRSIASGEINYGRWKIDSSNYDINPGPTSPGAPISGETIWLDTSDPTNPLLKLYINAEWKVIDPEGVMKSEVYDTQGKASDIFKYIDDVIAQSSVGEITELVNNHLKDTTIHTTATEKAKWRSSATEEELDTKVNTFIEEMNTIVTTEVNSNSTEVDSLSTNIAAEYEGLVTHASNTTIHPDSVKQAEWDAKADNDHTHILDGKVTISGDQIVGDLNNFDESKIPYTAKERIYTTSSYDEMNALKLDPVHNGDIAVMNDGTNKEYYEVTDESKLGTNSYKLIAISVTLPVSLRWYSVCYGKDKFVAVASTTKIFAYSSDGITWTQGTMPVSKEWNSVCYGKDNFVVVAVNSNIFAHLFLSNITTAFTQIPNNVMYDWNNIKNTPTTAEGYYISDAISKEEYDYLINQMTEESLSSDPGTVDLSNSVFTDTKVGQIVSEMDSLKTKLTPLDTYISQVNSLIKLQ